MTYKILFSLIFSNTVKPVLRGHPWDQKRWPYNSYYKTGDLLKEVQLI